MAPTNVGMPENDPVLLHAREHLRAQQTRPVARDRFLCFVRGCPVQAGKTEDLKRHFNRGWHSDANSGPLAVWDANRVFTVAEADYIADLGLTATKAATDAASFAAARLTAPVYDANNLADKAKTSFPRDPTWQPRVEAWKIGKGYKIAPGSAAASVPALVSVPSALPAGGAAAVAAVAPAAPAAPVAPVPAAPTLSSAGPASNSNNTTNTNTGRALVGAGEAAARAERKRKLDALVAAGPPRSFRKLHAKNGPRWFGLGPARLGGRDDEDDEDGE